MDIIKVKDNRIVVVQGGSKGTTGNTGPQGEQGISGAIGPQGIQGPQGDPGVSGATGPQGPQGVSGATGGGELFITGIDTVVNILAIVAPTPSELWIASGPGLDDLGNPVAEGDGLLFDGTDWVTIGPIQGPQGADGVGVVAGGTAGQVLTKIDGTDFNTEWTDGGSNEYQELEFLAQITPTTVVADSYKMYATASGVTPNRIVTISVINEALETIILSTYKS